MKAGRELDEMVAEKVMGFIKEDLRSIASSNIEEIRHRVTKYANFMSRVIYDMKWYDPPLQAIRSPIFETNLNEVIRFIVKNLCLRVAKQSDKYKFNLDLDENLPTVSINEFVIWEILEPLLQNNMDHSGDKQVVITVQSRFYPESGLSKISIADNGIGIEPQLLDVNEDGVKRIFMENISTKSDGRNSGYGCFLAYEISKLRVGWDLDAENLPEGGCKFTLVIPNSNEVIEERAIDEDDKMEAAGSD